MAKKPDTDPQGSNGPDDEQSHPVMVTVTVAKGRTLRAGDGDVGEGQTVELEEEEALRLFDLGFIADPDKAQVVTEGPTMRSAEGVNVRVAG